MAFVASILIKCRGTSGLEKRLSHKSSLKEYIMFRTHLSIFLASLQGGV